MPINTKFEDTADVAAEIDGACALHRDRYPWASAPLQTPTTAALAQSLSHDLLQRSAQLRAFSTWPNARNLAAQLDDSVRDLQEASRMMTAVRNRDSMRLFAVAVGAAVQALLYSNFNYRQAAQHPAVFTPAPVAAEEMAPMVRGRGRPKEPTPYEAYKDEPWFAYIPKRQPGRPAKNEIPWTHDTAIAHAKKTYHTEQMQAARAAAQPVLAPKSVRRPVKK